MEKGRAFLVRGVIPAAALGLAGACRSEPAARAPAAAEATPLPPHRVFPTAAAAVRAAAGEARIVAVGEVHATTDGPAVPPTIRRFADGMLPALAPRASDLLVETWALDGSCGAPAAAVVDTVREETRRPEATEDDIVHLARRARELGLTPHDLRFGCAEYDALRDEAGQVDYDALLGRITDKMAAFVAEAVGRPDVGLVVYGGAIHNDVDPIPEYAAFSYAAPLRERAGGALVEVDLFAPEQVAGNEVLLPPPWQALLGTATGPDRAVLVERAPDSFVVLLPETPGASAPAAGAGASAGEG